MNYNDISAVVGQMEYLLLDSETARIPYRLRNLMVFVEYHYDMIRKNDMGTLERILKINETIVVEHASLFEEKNKITEEYVRVISRLNQKSDSVC